MRHLFALLLFVALMLPGQAAIAQATAAEERDRGILTALIEDNLSGVSRTVVVDGFRGALSSRATVERITIADAEGVWLRAEGLVLDWDRGALFGGRIEVNELGAQNIEILRRPVAEDSLPNPEARPFSLPELPVAINIGQVVADRVFLGQPLIGQEMTLTLDGSVTLDGGVGRADISASRTDADGIFSIDAAYSNRTEDLSLDVVLSEPEYGAVANILGLPGRPSVDLSLRGAGPISDYVADLTLATDGVERAVGTFGFVSAQDDDGVERLDLRADVRGDVGALLPSDYASFFGPQSRLLVQAERRETGEVALPVLTIETQTLTLDGSAVIDGDGWPRSLRLEGLIAADDGAPVLLPIGGERTFVDRATIDLRYDIADGNAWSGRFLIDGVDRPGLSISELTLEGRGEIDPRQGNADGRFGGALSYGAIGLALDDPGLALAIGSEITGEIEIARDGDGPVRIDRLTVTGPGLTADGDLQIASRDEDFRTTSTIRLTAGDLSRFSVLSGVDGLRGTASLGIVTEIEPFNGVLDVMLSGDTRALALGIPEIDPLLAGDGTLTVAARRDETGTRLSALRIVTDEAEIIGSGEITSERTDAFIQLDLRELGVSVDGLTGPARIRAVAERPPRGTTNLRLTLEADGIDGTARAEIQPRSAGRGISGDAVLDIARIGPLARLAGQDITGAVRLSLSGATGETRDSFALDFEGTGTDIDPGIDRLTPLLAGEVRLDGRLTRNADGRLSVDDLTVAGDRIAATASGTFRPGGPASARFDATLPDLTVIDPQLAGRGTARGEAEIDPEGQSALVVALSGPGGLEAAIEAGRSAPDLPFDGSLSLEAGSLVPYSALLGRPLSGQVGLDAAGTFAPNEDRFDVTIDARSTQLRTGIAQADVLLAGDGRLSARIDGDTGGNIRLSDLVLSYPNLTAEVDLEARDGTGSASYSARLADIGLFTDDLSGPVTAQGTAALGAGGQWQVGADLSGPGGIGARVSGNVAGRQLGLAISGRAPLGLANRFIEPQRLQGLASFELAVNGPPALGSVSGTVTTDGARLALPVLEEALEDLDARITLSGGRANLDVTGAILGGGALAVTGDVEIAGRRNANLSIELTDVQVTDPSLYETEVDASIRLTGPIAGGGLVSGVINVGETEIRVPSSSVGVLGALPTVRHVGPSPDVRRTLSRAGLDLSGGEPARGNGGGRVALALDLVVNAPDRIFIRGRGLDAELGGRLRIAGTTARPIPSGQFSLIRGRLDVLQQRFVLNEGSATLSGEFIPLLRLVASTEARDGTLVTIIVEGPANAPQITFESSPELPPDEVLARLIFGRNLTEITPLQAVQLASAAATLAGRGGGSFVGDFRDSLGLDNLDIATDDEGNFAVEAGAYLGENVYTDVTVGADRTEVELNLDLTDDLTVTGRADSDGETGLGIFFERDY